MNCQNMSWTKIRKLSRVWCAKFEVPDASSEGGFARSERDRLVDLERQLSATLAAHSERDQRLAQLTDEPALKNALLKQAKANSAEAMKHAGLELCKHTHRLLELEIELRGGCRQRLLLKLSVTNTRHS